MSRPVSERQPAAFEPDTPGGEWCGLLRTMLLHGWDDLDLTLSHAEAIAAVKHADRRRRPWMAPLA